MSDVAMETRSRNASDEIKDDPNNADAPSGFILKLYQMVNGAPDEVISWTPAGDAFIIGSDIKRLESETLPQYFRHNRFQSLVRQLNFYSFRKINRERNVWIYKHELFHRERPGDLHLVRRRTCPGLDGRKQRFSRYSARKLTDNNNSGGSEDESSDEDGNPTSPVQVEHTIVPEKIVKRISSEESSLEDPKKRRRHWESEVPESPVPEKNVVVDTSLLFREAEETKVEEPEDETSQKSPVIERTEMAEHSLIVSEVAKKLEKYARMAFGSSYGAKNKRHASGVVTPPFATSLSATHLLTYDDEFVEEKEHPEQPSRSTRKVDNKSPVEDPAIAETTVAVFQQKECCATPAGDVVTARAIAERMIITGTPDCVSKAAVASFCITTAPSADKDIGIKILQLMASCEELAADFQTYRAALDPFSTAESGELACNSSRRMSCTSATMQQTWSSEASRSNAVHDFTVFAVNSIHEILGKRGVTSETASVLTEQDTSVLERTIQVWSKNV